MSLDPTDVLIDINSGKKFFPGGKFKLDDEFHVAHMTPVLHYTMGGLEIDPASRVMSEEGKPIVNFLFLFLLFFDDTLV